MITSIDIFFSIACKTYLQVVFTEIFITREDIFLLLALRENNSLFEEEDYQFPRSVLRSHVALADEQGAVVKQLALGHDVALQTNKQTYKNYIYFKNMILHCKQKTIQNLHKF